MRSTEILNMKRDWIDLNQNIITVKKSVDFKTKSKRERIIPSHQKIKTIIDRYSNLKFESNNDFF